MSYAAAWTMSGWARSPWTCTTRAASQPGQEQSRRPRRVGQLDAAACRRGGAAAGCAASARSLRPSGCTHPMPRACPTISARPACSRLDHSPRALPVPVAALVGSRPCVLGSVRVARPTSRHRGLTRPRPHHPWGFVRPRDRWARPVERRRCGGRSRRRLPRCRSPKTQWPSWTASYAPRATWTWSAACWPAHGTGWRCSTRSAAAVAAGALTAARAGVAGVRGRLAHPG